MSDELDRFKRIDLRAYAASVGYEFDKAESWRGSAVMRLRSTDDKIVISRDADGHYIYYSFRDEKRDHGTIIDFVLNRQCDNFGEVRKILRAYSGASPLPVMPPLEKTTKDQRSVEVEFRRMPRLRFHDYLEKDRRLPIDLLTSERFAGRIKVDSHANAVFPHFNNDGICGYELRNREFKGFSPGGSKGLWCSHVRDDDERLILAEGAIDALSYAALFPDAHSRYVSIGGKTNSEQPVLIRRCIEKMPSGGTIVAAMDNDDDGWKLADMVRQVFEDVGRQDIDYVDNHPEEPGADWNDMLTRRPLHFFSYRP
jgi:hypothetical protein